MDNGQAFSAIRNELTDSNTVFVNAGLSVERKIGNNASPQMPNVIMVTIESFSADFMGRFGNTNKLTPVLD